MILFIVSAAVLIVSVFALGYVIFKKIPDLKNLNVESLTEEQQEKARQEMLEAKFFRISDKLKSKFSKVALPSRGFLSGKISQIKERVAELESQYQDGKEAIEKPKTVEELFSEAEKLMSEDNYAEAERILIEIIASDNKNIIAYEMLGDLYFQTKAYDQAEEIYHYLLKIKLVGRDGNSFMRGSKMGEIEADVLSTLDVDNQIAVYYEDLGQVYEAQDKKEKALDAYLKATSIDPNNPKYLDKLLVMSIEFGDRGLAKRTFNSMRKINPNNAKLDDWAKAIEKL